MRLWCFGRGVRVVLFASWEARWGALSHCAGVRFRGLWIVCVGGDGGHRACSCHQWTIEIRATSDDVTQPSLCKHTHTHTHTRTHSHTRAGDADWRRDCVRGCGGIRAPHLPPPDHVVAVLRMLPGAQPQVRGDGAGRHHHVDQPARHRCHRTRKGLAIVRALGG